MPPFSDPKGTKTAPLGEPGTTSVLSAEYCAFESNESSRVDLSLSLKENKEAEKDDKWHLSGSWPLS